MKKNNREPELETYTLLNPDFLTFESQFTNEQKHNENQEDQDASTNSE